MKRSHFALLTLSLGLTACSSQLRQAPVIERTPIPAAAPAPVVAEPPPKVDAKGTYTVRKGDTLIRIALDHGLNYRDLAAWNNLSYGTNENGIAGTDVELKINTPIFVNG